MKALRKINFGYDNMLYDNVPEVFPNENEVKIRVLFTGICGSDIHAFKGEYNKVAPLTLGHEFVGEVVEIGKNVSSLKIGTIVSSETTFEVCEKCEYCLNEEYNLCSFRKGIGTQVDGSFSEFVIAKAERCHIIPDSIDPQIAAMLEPLACCVHAAIEKTSIKAGEQVAVFGPGPIGLIMSLVLKAYDAQVTLIGITRDEERLAFAKKIGIDHTINSQTTDLTERINLLTNSHGVSQVFECSGNIKAVHQAFSILKKKGKIIQEGLFAEDMNELNLSQLIHKELQYIGSRTQKPSSWKKALELLDSKKIDLSPLISMILPLDEWKKALELVMEGEQLKVLLAPKNNG